MHNACDFHILVFPWLGLGTKDYFRLTQIYVHINFFSTHRMFCFVMYYTTKLLLIFHNYVMNVMKIAQ